MSDTSPSPESSSSSSCEHDASDNEEYPYYVVEFSKRGRKTTKSFDVVASKWLTYNKIKSKLECKYMAPTHGKYSKEDCQLIRDLASMNADAPESWPKFNCTVRGQAKTFEAAENKANSLDFKEYVFTSDSQVEPEQKQKEIEMLIKQKSLKEQQAKSEAAMKAMKCSSNVKENKGEKSNSSKNQRSQAKTGAVKKVINYPSHITQNKEEKKINISELPTSKAIKKLAPKKKETLPSGNSEKYNNWENIKKPGTASNITTTEWMKRIDSRLTSVENQLELIIYLLRETNNCNIQPVPAAISRQFEFELPCKSLEDLKQLNIMLENSTHSEHLMDSLCFSTNFKLSVGKALTKMMKICLIRDVAMKLTAQKKMPNKEVMKSTPLCNLLIKILRTKLAVENEDEALTAIGDVLGNAKDWDGKRKERTEKNNIEYENKSE